MNAIAKKTQMTKEFDELRIRLAVPQTAVTHKIGGLHGSSR